jgi:fructose-specific phosphotransferase system IIC component
VHDRWTPSPFYSSSQSSNLISLLCTWRRSISLYAIIAIAVVIIAIALFVATRKKKGKQDAESSERMGGAALSFENPMVSEQAPPTSFLARAFTLLTVSLILQQSHRLILAHACSLMRSVP